MLDGITVCRRLRESGDNTPVLMLTARDTVFDRVVGLDTGADDYLTKPFVLEELLASDSSAAAAQLPRTRHFPVRRRSAQPSRSDTPWSARVSSSCVQGRYHPRSSGTDQHSETKLQMSWASPQIVEAC